MELCSKVEDYYAIVKEPMDFGTMRAKLHEGMYRSLEQFEVYSLYFIYAHVVFSCINLTPLVSISKYVCLNCCNVPAHHLILIHGI